MYHTIVLPPRETLTKTQQEAMDVIAQQVEEGVWFAPHNVLPVVFRRPDYICEGLRNKNHLCRRPNFMNTGWEYRRRTDDE